MVSRDSIFPHERPSILTQIFSFWFYTWALDETGLLSQVYDENGPNNLRQTIGLIVENLNPWQWWTASPIKGAPGHLSSPRLSFKYFLISPIHPPATERLQLSGWRWPLLIPSFCWMAPAKMELSIIHGLPDSWEATSVVSERLEQWLLASHMRLCWALCGQCATPF